MCECEMSLGKFLLIDVRTDWWRTNERQVWRKQQEQPLQISPVKLTKHASEQEKWRDWMCKTDQPNKRATATIQQLGEDDSFPTTGIQECLPTFFHFEVHAESCVAASKNPHYMFYWISDVDGSSRPAKVVKFPTPAKGLLVFTLVCGKLGLAIWLTL